MDQSELPVTSVRPGLRSGVSPAGADKESPTSNTRLAPNVVTAPRRVTDWARFLVSSSNLLFIFYLSWFVVVFTTDDTDDTNSCDLIPSASVPICARVAPNGSQCGRSAMDAQSHESSRKRVMDFLDWFAMRSPDCSIKGGLTSVLLLNSAVRDDRPASSSFCPPPSQFCPPSSRLSPKPSKHLPQNPPAVCRDRGEHLSSSLLRVARAQALPGPILL